MRGSDSKRAWACASDVVLVKRLPSGVWIVPKTCWEISGVSSQALSGRTGLRSAT
jgi:hypothetical protein